MNDPLPCPICHNTGPHKMDCQNATYVRRWVRHVEELEKTNNKQALTIFDLTKRIEELEETIERVSDVRNHLIRTFPDRRSTSYEGWDIVCGVIRELTKALNDE